MKIILLENVTVFYDFCSNLILTQLKKNCIFCFYYLHVDKQTIREKDKRLHPKIPHLSMGTTGIHITLPSVGTSY